MRKLLGTLIILFAVYTTPGWAQRVAVFPEFASGGNWTSEFMFTNQDLSAVTGIVVNFYDESGNPLTITSNLGTASSYTFNLAAGATQQITVTPAATAVVGYAVMTYPGNAPIRASVIYKLVSGNTVFAEVGVPQQEQGDHFSFPVEINPPNVNTSVTLVNPAAYNSAAVDEYVILNLINPDGTLKQQLPVLLHSGEHIDRYLDKLFPNLGAFTGSMTVASPLGVGVLAIHWDGNAFGSIATDGGPVLGAFALASTPIPEVEPNNTMANAQPISGSVVISGTINAGGDEDVYKFTGKAGDIISVLCTTEGLGSSLDATIGIYTSSAQPPIAWNDQDGLAPGGYPSNDSFIQLVLPADGTYYIVISDYNNVYFGAGVGGSNYTYMLHVKLP